MTRSAVIFDLDGTLLDTIEDITAALNRVLDRRGQPPCSIQECKAMVGEGMETLVRRAFPGEAGAGAVEDFVRQFRTEYAELWRDHSRPYPGIPELLAELESRNVRTAVLSNKSHPFTEAMVRELLPFSFEVVRGAMPDIPHKPDPAAALLIASQMALEPRQFVFLGDTGIDMKTAVAAGMFPAGALWGFRDAAELIEAGAAVLFEYPLDLMRDSGLPG